MQSSLSIDVDVARPGGPTDPAHDAHLRRGDLETHVSRPVAWTLVLTFLLAIFAVPIAQAIAENADGDEIGILALFRHWPTRERLRLFEKELSDVSHAKDYVQPRVQLWLSRFGRVGNKRAAIGQAGWLYYTPGIAHVAGPPFLDADAIARRERESGEDGSDRVHADPLPAIFAFADMLSARGIKLIVFAVPDKAMVQPAELHGRTPKPNDTPQNGSWSAFVAALVAHGVVLFDPSPPVRAPSQPPRFLVEDTHWTPAWMRDVARDLARTVQHTASLPAIAEPRWRVAEEQVARVGDLVDMLKLPEKQALFLPERVTIQAVSDENGDPWEPDPTADVLLLGDSFTNVFSSEPMGWGAAAGLAPHLAVALDRPLDVVAQNDSGAFATRQALAGDLAAGIDRLAGKRVVIWEFASRELSVGDWKPISWPLPKGTRVSEGGHP